MSEPNDLQTFLQNLVPEIDLSPEGEAIYVDEPFEEEEGRFVRVDATRGCRAYGSGSCCYDRHFDPHDVMPGTELEALCDDKRDWERSSANKQDVNCRECLERIHS